MVFCFIAIGRRSAVCCVAVGLPAVGGVRRGSDVWGIGSGSAVWGIGGGSAVGGWVGGRLSGGWAVGRRMGGGWGLGCLGLCRGVGVLVSVVGWCSGAR